MVNAWQTLPNDALAGRDPDDPRHPLYQALSELDAAGVDVIFSAPDHHAERIHGPALHPSVLTVTAVNLDGTPFDSSVERLCPRSGKPDIANYQGFAGYELFKNKEGETRIDRQLISEGSALDEVNRPGNSGGCLV